MTRWRDFDYSVWRTDMTKLLVKILLELSFLVGGIVLVGLGSNFYLGFGLACLMIYGKSVK
jgi:hypothetical protein